MSAVRRRRLGAALLALFAFLLLAVPATCRPPASTASGSLRVVHLTDLHYDEAPRDILGRTVALIRRLDPDLILCGGDLMTDPTEQGYAEIRDAFAALPAPVLYAPGNHDHRDLPLYRRFFGEPFSSLDVGDFHFIAVDTGAAAGLFSRLGRGLSAEQLRWLQGDLAKARGKSVFILMHHSPMVKGETFKQGRDEFVRLAREHGVKGILAGHMHRDAVYDLDGCQAEVSLAQARLPVIHTTTVGSSRLKGPYRGLRLLILHREGIAPETPAASIPLDGPTTP